MSKISSFRIAVAQASSFGLSPAPGMIWATHEGPAAAATPSSQAAKDAAPQAEACELSQ
jgi:hypothetical protein